MAVAAAVVVVAAAAAVREAPAARPTHRKHRGADCQRAECKPNEEADGGERESGMAGGGGGRRTMQAGGGASADVEAHFESQ